MTCLLKVFLVSFLRLLEDFDETSKQYYARIALNRRLVEGTPHVSPVCLTNATSDGIGEALQRYWWVHDEGLQEEFHFRQARSTPQRRFLWRSPSPVVFGLIP